MIRFAQGASRFVPVNEKQTHYQEYNAEDVNKPGLLFIHGMWAHLHWWDHIAPFFMANYRVVAMDLGGMGESEARSAYDVAGYTDEVISVIKNAGLAKATIIAHSFGCSPALFTCHRCPDIVQRAILIDSRLNIPNVPKLPPKKSEVVTKRHVYPRANDAIGRYRLIPPGAAVEPDLLRHIASNSIRKDPDGWVWKFDLGINPRLAHEPDASIPSGITTPIDFIYGGQSPTMSREIASTICNYFQNCKAPICIPDASHHVLLDYPEALISILSTLLSPSL